MKKTFIAELVLIGILIVLLVLLMDPFNIIMKLMLSAAVVALLAIVYTVKFWIIFREKPQDERYLQHRFYSSWWSYSVVSAVLFIGVVYESMHGKPDIWLVISFISLLLMKLCSLIYLEVYK